MTVETASFIHQLNPLLPEAADGLSEGDNHLRLLKSALQANFPNLTGAITKTQDEINNLIEATDALTALAALTPADGKLLAFSGPTTAELITVSDYVQTLLDDADAAAARGTLGLGSLATKSTVATADLSNDAVTFAKMQNINTARLLGRTTASAGDVEEISIGTGLAMAAGVLSLASSLQVAIYQDQKTNGSGGGTPVASTWTKRTCNDVVANTTGITESSSVFTLPVGKWLIFAEQAFYNVTSGYASRIQNVSDGTTIALGRTGSNTGLTVPSTAMGYLEVTSGTKNVELEYFCGSAVGNGLGLAASPGSNAEVYSSVLFVKIG